MNHEEYMDMMREESEAEDLILLGYDWYNSLEVIVTEEEWDHVGPDDPYWLTHEEVL